MQWLKVSTSYLVHSLGGQLGPSLNRTNDKVGIGHGMLRSLQNLASPFNIFAMAEVAMDVPNRRYYIEKLQTLI